SEVSRLSVAIQVDAFPISKLLSEVDTFPILGRVEEVDVFPIPELFVNNSAFQSLFAMMMSSINLGSYRLIFYSQK
ncbi:hypothetical protein, partial [Pantoea ananatis]|uniref:hypothetical protein n=1 Tax=Pantoea ananas TaxID=553 RepID=UPI0021F73CF1